MAAFFQVTYPPSVGIIAAAATREQASKGISEASTKYCSSTADDHDSTGLNLHHYFPASAVLPWNKWRFKMVRKLQEAARNMGHVDEMEDTTMGSPVAVKQMPNSWVCESHADFAAKHPRETEQPWLDVGCTKWLNDQGFPYACELVGVYRDTESTYVVSELASEGDLFSWCHEVKTVPGVRREQLIRPIITQLFEAVRTLHDLQIAHRDLSLENVLLSKHDRASRSRLEAACLKVIDFSMVATRRMLEHSSCAKPSYQAPEMHSTGPCDAFLADAFSVGVTLYALLCKDYPWMSTKPGRCKLFSYVQTKGFRAYVKKQRIPGQPGRVEDHLSPEALDLLEGLLELDPAKRLTLGEGCFEGRRSVLDMPWLGKAPVPGG